MTPDVTDSDGGFRDAVIEAFDGDRRGDDAHASSTAQWTAAAMRDSLQDALSMIWIDFYRSGLAVQPYDGITRSDLRALVRDGLVANAELQIGDATIATAPDDPADAWIDRISERYEELSWQELCDVAIDADSALTGLAVLFALTRHVPEPTKASDAWLQVARINGNHQPDLLQMAGMLKRRQAQTRKTVGSLLQWVIDTFIVRVHDTVAMGKLPESTFHFS